MRALCLAPPDGPGAQWRLAQYLDLAARLGARTDLVLGRDLAGAPGIGPLCARAARVAVSSGSEDAALVVHLTASGSYDIAIAGRTDGMTPGQRRTAARLWVADMPGAGAGAEGADLTLAPLDAQRRAAPGPALRLPLVAPATGRCGDMLGWSGSWPPGLAEAMSAVLDRLAGWGAKTGSGILLAGPGAAAVRVPGRLASRTIVRDQAPGAAIGLALVPGIGAEAVPALLPTLLSRLAGGCPVLTTPDAAAVFEDRWHLPTAADPEGLAKCVADTDTAELAEGTRQTRRAFARDAEAMRAYLIAELRRMLERAPDPQLA